MRRLNSRSNVFIRVCFDISENRSIAETVGFSLSRETCLIQRPNENKTYVYDDDISECVDLSEYN